MRKTQIIILFAGLLLLLGNEAWSQTKKAKVNTKVSTTGGAVENTRDAQKVEAQQKQDQKDNTTEISNSDNTNAVTTDATNSSKTTGNNAGPSGNGVYDVDRQINGKPDADPTKTPKKKAKGSSTRETEIPNIF